MKRIKLIKLILKNFKGIKDLEINFGDLTDISGDNGTGKTTIYDGYTWLILDRDSSFRQNFEIKTLQPNNEAIHNLDHEVTGVFDIDGKKINFTKIYKEKWTKKKGEVSRQLTSHETLYYVNEIPVKQSEYRDTINKIIGEQLFKLICNPLYFNMNMKWEERRDVIMNIAGEIPAEKVLDYNIELSALKPLLKDTDIETLKKSTAVKKKKLNDEAKGIPYRLDELSILLQECDSKEVETEIRENENYIKELEDEILFSCNNSNEGLEEKRRLYDLKCKLLDMEYNNKVETERECRELIDKAEVLDIEVNKITRNIEEININKSTVLAAIEDLEKANEILRAKWHEINDKEFEFHEQDFVCPVCRRPFEEENIEVKQLAMVENYNDDKETQLKEITSEGIGNDEKIKEYRLQIENMDNELGFLQEKLNIEQDEKNKILEKLNNFVPSNKLEENIEYVEVIRQIEELESKTYKPVDPVRISALKARKAELYGKIYELKKLLYVKEQNETIENRIKELTDEKCSLDEQIAKQEEIEALCEEYEKTRGEMLEADINSKFKLVKFKLLNTLVNGKVEECCEALINGVPISNANKASQINGGLDIINTLCCHYGVQAPVFIDNRESVNELLECGSQVINLFVSKDKTLKIESKLVSCDSLINDKDSENTKLLATEKTLRDISPENVSKDGISRKYNRTDGPGF